MSTFFEVEFLLVLCGNDWIVNYLYSFDYVLDRLCDNLSYLPYNDYSFLTYLPDNYADFELEVDKCINELVRK